MSLAAGALLCVLGALVPSSTWVAWLRQPPPDLAQALLDGALCLRVCLVALGLAVIGLGRYAARLGGGAQPPRFAPPAMRSPWPLVGLLVVAAALRLWALGEGFWYDEIAAYVNYGGMTPGEIVTTYDSQNQHVLYSLLARLSLDVGGGGVAAFRLPAALFGVASIAMLYVFASRLVGRRDALLASALLTFSYHHVWFSQNARGYIGLLFWTLLASWALVRALDDGRPRSWVLYAVASALGAWTLPTMVFVVAGHFVIYVARDLRAADRRWSRRLVGLAFGFGLAGLLTLLLYAFVLPQMLGGTLSGGGAVAAWKDPVWALREAVRGLAAALPGGAAGVAVACVALAGVGLGLHGLRRSSPVVLWLLGLPVVLTAAVVIARGHHLWPRFFFFAAGFGAMVAVAAAMAVGDVVGRLGRRDAVFAERAGVVLAVLGIAVSAISVPRAYAPKQDFEAARRYVETQRAPDDEVVTVGLARFPYSEYLETDWRPVDEAEWLARPAEPGSTTWLVYTFPFHLKSMHPEIWAAVERDFEEVAWFHGTLGGGAIVVARR